MLNSLRAGIVALAAAATGGSASAGLVAYNDFYVSGSPANAVNVTAVGGNSSGGIKDQATGAAMGTLAITTATGAGAGNSGTAYPAGEAKTAFDGILNNAVGYVYSQSTSVPTVFVLSGLDSSAKYDLVLFAYSNQNQEVSHIVLSGAVSFQNVTTTGTAFPANKGDRDANHVGGVISTTSTSSDTTVISQNGMTVAHYTNIVPSAAGTFAFNLYQTSGDTAGRVNGMKLTVVPEPASMGLIGLGGMVVLSRRRKMM